MHLFDPSLWHSLVLIFGTLPFLPLIGNTAQTVLTQGNQTQRLSDVTQTVTSVVPWIVLAVLAFLAIKVFAKGK